MIIMRGPIRQMLIIHYVPKRLELQSDNTKISILYMLLQNLAVLSDSVHGVSQANKFLGYQAQGVKSWDLFHYDKLLVIVVRTTSYAFVLHSTS